MKIVGLISGTSADAIDAALVSLDGQRMKLENFCSRPYPGEVREQLFALFEDRATVRQASRMNFLLGELFAQAALEVMQGQSADLVASHGQTVAHLPYQDVPNTLQIGEGAVIAARTGLPTISDFRTADMALGGQAAPLVPFFDAWLLRHPEFPRAAINIGGMANVSWIPPNGEVLGWDSGPGNVVMDALAERVLQQSADFGGALASQGEVKPELLERMLAHPYFVASGPKSTGREDFGRDFIGPYLDLAEPADLMRTALQLTVESLAASIERVHRGPVEVVVGGGGWHNPVLMEALRVRLGLQQLASFADFGISADAREACAFALFGYQTWHRQASSLPSVTGASGPAILGKISYPPPA
jgi:anhydro-N-acetylmuramic acid kinase